LLNSFCRCHPLKKGIQLILAAAKVAQGAGNAMDGAASKFQ
jgi:hypothetical protein